jgi:hypothetical protein
MALIGIAIGRDLALSNLAINLILTGGLVSQLDLVVGPLVGG